jgi:hypothetical protein
VYGGKVPRKKCFADAYNMPVNNWFHYLNRHPLLISELRASVRYFSYLVAAYIRLMLERIPRVYY